MYFGTTSTSNTSYANKISTVLHNGKIVKSGGKELAHELEDTGYDWLK